ANCKHHFDNRHGTGQSVWDAVMNTTNHLIAGKNVVVCGYGFCGNGVALRARGLGANVIICEVDPFRALEAYADGYRVMSLDEAAAIGDIFVTTTGCRDIIRTRHFERMKDGALLANAGHFDVEINKDELAALAVSITERKPNIAGYTLPDGRVLNLLGEGRLVNLAAGNGHPAEIMDLSFGIQALSVEHLAKNGALLAPGVYPVPPAIDECVARIKLRAMGISLDVLTHEQTEYLKKW
ncbi:MAG: adenosylhomocysteinase, partial [Clostridia bacterium]